MLFLTFNVLFGLLTFWFLTFWPFPVLITKMITAFVTQAYSNFKSYQLFELFFAPTVIIINTRLFSYMKQFRRNTQFKSYLKVLHSTWHWHLNFNIFFYRARNFFSFFAYSKIHLNIQEASPLLFNYVQLKKIFFTSTQMRNLAFFSSCFFSFFYLTMNRRSIANFNNLNKVLFF